MVVEDKYKFEAAEKLRFMKRIEAEVAKVFHCKASHIIPSWYLTKRELQLEYISKSMRQEKRKILKRP